jgi:hypothetical protein
LKAVVQQAPQVEMLGLTERRLPGRPLVRKVVLPGQALLGVLEARQHQESAQRRTRAVPVAPAVRITPVAVVAAPAASVVMAAQAARISQATSAAHPAAVRAAARRALSAALVSIVPLTTARPVAITRLAQDQAQAVRLDRVLV